MSAWLITVIKFVVSYLLAGAAYVLFARWPHYESHAHLPFSGFPEFLVWAPFAPYFMFEELISRPGSAAEGILVFSAVLGVALWACFRSRRRVTRRT